MCVNNSATCKAGVCICSNKPKPRVHAQLIKAWADGAKIQVKQTTGEHIVWVDAYSPGWNPYHEYRIKPESKSPGELMCKAWGFNWEIAGAMSRIDYEEAADKFVKLYNESRNTA